MAASMAETASSALMQARQDEEASRKTTLSRAASKEDIELAEHLLSHSRAQQNGGERTLEAHNGSDVSPEQQHIYASRETELGDVAFEQTQDNTSRSGTAEREPFGPQPNVLSAGQKCRYEFLVF